jgi:hypothetical protein
MLVYVLWERTDDCLVFQYLAEASITICFNNGTRPRRRVCNELRKEGHLDSISSVTFTAVVPIPMQTTKECVRPITHRLVFCLKQIQNCWVRLVSMY